MPELRIDKHEPERPEPYLDQLSFLWLNNWLASTKLELIVILKFLFVDFDIALGV